MVSYSNEHFKERQNMKEASRTRKNGEWVIVAYIDRNPGLQGWGYESKERAIEVMEELMQTEEYMGVLHEVMTKTEFEKEFDREVPW